MRVILVITALLILGSVQVNMLRTKWNGKNIVQYYSFRLPIFTDEKLQPFYAVARKMCEDEAFEYFDEGYEYKPKATKERWAMVGCVLYHTFEDPEVGDILAGRSKRDEKMILKFAGCVFSSRRYINNNIFFPDYLDLGRRVIAGNACSSARDWERYPSTWGTK